MIPFKTFCYVVREMVEVAAGEVADHGITNTISNVASFESTAYPARNHSMQQQNHHGGYPNDINSSSSRVAETVESSSNNSQSSVSDQQVSQLKVAIDQVDTKEVLSEVWSDIASLGIKAKNSVCDVVENVSTNVTKFSETTVENFTRSFSTLSLDIQRKYSSLASNSAKASSSTAAAMESRSDEAGREDGNDVEGRNSSTDEKVLGHEGTRDNAPVPFPSSRISSWRTSNTEERSYGGFSVVNGTGSDGSYIVVDGDTHVHPRRKRKMTTNKLMQRQLGQAESIASHRMHSSWEACAEPQCSKSPLTHSVDSETGPTYGVILASPKHLRHVTESAILTSDNEYPGMDRRDEYEQQQPYPYDKNVRAPTVRIVAAPSIGSSGTQRTTTKATWFPRKRRTMMKHGKRFGTKTVELWN